MIDQHEISYNSVTYISFYSYNKITSEILGV